MNTAKKHDILSPKELNHRLTEGRPVYLIDVLGNDHFRLVHIPGALSTCVYEVTFLEQVKAITEDRNAPVVIYGSGSRSMDSVKAAEKLQREGYTDVQVLKGGLEAWRKAGLPLEGDAVDEDIDPYTILKLKTRNGTFEADREQSIIQWTGRNMNSIHVGSIKLAGGEIKVRDGRFGGKFHLDMDSIENFDLEGNELQPILINHLKSDDFFFTKLFPDAVFEIIDAAPVDEPYLSSPNYKIKGRLTLRGVKLTQEFMATVIETPPDRVTAEAHFDIDRTRWGIIYGSARFFEYLGMHLVFDLISIQVKIVILL